MASGDLVVNLIARTNQFTGPIGSARKSFSGFVSSAMTGLAKFGLAVQGLKSVLSAISEPIALAQEQIASERKLEQAIKSTGAAAGFSADQLKRYAAERQKITNFGDEQTIAAAAVLATFTKIQGVQFKQALDSAQDMSTLLGGDLQSSIIQIGKALNDPIRGMTALTRSGVSFTEEQKTQIKNLAEQGDLIGAQKIILGELSTQFGGQAEALVDPLKQAAALWSDIKEEVGKIALEFGPAILQFMQGLGIAINNLGEEFKRWAIIADRIADTLPGIESNAEQQARFAKDLELSKAATARGDAGRFLPDAFERFGLGKLGKGVKESSLGQTVQNTTGLVRQVVKEYTDFVGPRMTTEMAIARGKYDAGPQISANLLAARNAAFEGPMIPHNLQVQRDIAANTPAQQGPIGELRSLERGSQSTFDVLRANMGTRGKEDEQLKETQKQTEVLQDIKKSLESTATIEQALAMIRDIK